ncbi:hypothetical protein BBK82_37630 [Lentzea guizhouensis]|uniref:PPE domain-containing protein n=1 Tax=Lentzea guizhouensis TaxID=1586287 RepID=A0A1B2HT02_9PSEU|nr:PPE domain-containing protein [Lentzea guizhouensis]ANZ40859.1 hypothetical protein BBK82_37630 [Lentzea guizhouensis]
MSGRDKGYYSEEHEPSAKQVRRARRLSRQRRANLREDAFDAGTIRWDAYTHQQLWDMVHSADLPGMSVRTGQWQELAPRLRDTSRSVQDIANKLASSWRGPSAELAAQAASALTSWGETVGDSTARVAKGLDDYTSVLQETKRRLPEPVHYWAERRFNEGYDVKVADGPQGLNLLEQLTDDHMPTKVEARNAKAETVAVMQVYESESRNTRSTLPVFDTAPPTAQQPGPAAPPPPVVAGPEAPRGPEATPKPPERVPVPDVPRPVSEAPTARASRRSARRHRTLPGTTSGGPGTHGGRAASRRVRPERRAAPVRDARHRSGNAGQHRSRDAGRRRCARPAAGTRHRGGSGRSRRGRGAGNAGVRHDAAAVRRRR